MARPNRTLVLTAAGIVAAIAFMLMGVLIFLSGDAGRAFVTARAVPMLSRALDQEVGIRETSGDWPGEIILTGVTVSDAKGAWLEINRLRLAWRPFALLRGRTTINTVHIDDAHLLRFPDARTPPSPTPSAPPDLLALRDTLDAIRVDEFSITTLRLEPEVFGNAATISVRAALKPEAGMPVLTVALERRDAPGTATLVFQLGDGDLALKAKIAIAGVDLDGDVAMRGPTQALSGTVRGSCGGDGFCVKWPTGQLGGVTADAVLGGTRGAPAADLSFHLRDLRESGRSLDALDGVISLKPDIAAQTLRLSGRGSAGGLKKALPEAGSVMADAGNWSVAGNVKGNTTVLDTFTLTAGDVEAVLTGTLTGTTLSGAGLSLDVKGAGRLADIKDTASRTRAALRVTRANLGAPLSASGTLALTIENLPAEAIPAPAFHAPLKINAAVILSPERLNIGGVSATWGPAAFKGESILARNAAGFDHLSTTGNLVIAPNAFETQTKPIQVDTKLDGGFAALNAVLTATLDAYQRGAATFTGIKSTIQAKRSVEGWQGDLRAEAVLNDAPVTLMSSATQSAAETVISGIHLKGAGADLKGDLRMSKNGKAATGTLAGPVNDLMPWTSLAGYPVKGRGDLKIVLSGDTQQHAAATLDATAISSSVLDAEYLKMTAAVDDAFGKAKVNADLRATEGDISHRRFDHLTASADGHLKMMKVVLHAKGTRLRRFTVDLAGTVAVDGKTDITLTHFMLEDAALRAGLTQPARLTISDDAIVLAPMRLAVGTGMANAEFNLMRRTQQVDGRIAMAGLTLGDPKDMLSLGQTSFDGTITLSGPATDAETTATLTARFQPRDPGGQAITGKLDLHARGGRAVISGTGIGFSRDDARFSANIPAKIDLSGPRIALDMQAPVTGDLVWKGDVKPLWQLLGRTDQHTLAGQTNIDIKVSGSLEQPAVTGGIRLSKGLYENLISGTALHNVELDIAAQSGSLVNVKLTASDTGAGRATLQGTLRNDSSGWAADVAGDLKEFHVLRRDDLTAAASGHVTYKGPVLGGTLGGTLQIEHSEYRLGESYQPEVLLLRGLASKATADSRNAGITLDVSLSLPDVLRTEGQGLEAFWRGDVRVTGDLNHPDLVGQLTLARGTFGFLGTTFDLDSGTVTFTGGGNIDPELNIIATRQAEEIIATVTICGRASQPTMTLSSQPALPQDEVLARLLFRKGTTQLGPLESLQLANAAADLSGISRGGLSGALRRASGLDIVGFGGQSGNAVVLGRQFSRALYVGIEQNVNDSQRRIVIEWRLTRQLSLQSTTTGEAGADLGLLWRKNY